VSIVVSILRATMASAIVLRSHVDMADDFEIESGVHMCQGRGRVEVAQVGSSEERSGEERRE